jgi:prevent-host-death family protein
MLIRNRRNKKSSPPGIWKLLDAKARISEVVRKAKTDGPQRVTVHGKDTVVVVAASDFDESDPCPQNGLTGAVFVEAMQQARKRGLRLKPLHYYPAYRPPVDFSDDGR